MEKIKLYCSHCGTPKEKEVIQQPKVEVMFIYCDNCSQLTFGTLGDRIDKLAALREELKTLADMMAYAKTTYTRKFKEYLRLQKGGK